MKMMRGIESYEKVMMTLYTFILYNEMKQCKKVMNFPQLNSVDTLCFGAIIKLAIGMDLLKSEHCRQKCFKEKCFVSQKYAI